MVGKASNPPVTGSCFLLENYKHGRGIHTFQVNKLCTCITVFYSRSVNLSL